MLSAMALKGGAGFRGFARGAPCAWESHIFGVLGFFKAGKRQAWTPEQERAMEANGRLQRWNSKGLWPECLVEAAARDLSKGLWPECLVEAAARDFRGFRVFQAWQTAGLIARTREGYGGKRQAATLEQQRLVARVLGGSWCEGFSRF